MTLDEAQADSRRAYVGGGPGVFVSALVWLATGLVERDRGSTAALAVLFVGGALIFPLGLGVARFLFRRAPTRPDNALGVVALESTVAMIGGLFAAWLFLPLAPGRALPLAAVAVGTHYAAFRTVYDDRRFWLLAGVMTATGVTALVNGSFPAGTVALVVAGVEFAFAVLLTGDALRPQRA